MNTVQEGVLERVRAFRLSPTQTLIIGFAALIALGTLLLMLPFASAGGRSIRFLDALFTSTSAVCVTGLIVLDTPNDFSLFGQIVILLLFQIGGVGYMTVATLFLVALGRRIGLRERLAIQEMLNTFTMEGLVRFIFGIVKFTLVVELVGAVLLASRFLQEMPPMQAVYFGIFHSVSAFNNAGFALFSNSLMDYRSDPLVSVVAIVLIVLGGLGFLVYQDILRIVKREIFRFSLHTKIVLVTSAILILLGVAGLWVFERQNPASLGNLSFNDQVLAALFQSVSARTTGLNTIDIGSLSSPALYLLVILMMIGASPGSAGGGIKTTSVALMAVAMWTTMRGHGEVTVFYRRIPAYVIARAFFVAALAMILVTGTTLLLLYSEDQSLSGTLFEVASAFGTVGYSTGDGGVRSFSALFSDFGKWVIILTMLLGRIGPLAIGITAANRPRHELFRYPEGKVMIG